MLPTESLQDILWIYQPWSYNRWVCVFSSWSGHIPKKSEWKKMEAGFGRFLVSWCGAFSIDLRHLISMTTVYALVFWGARPMGIKVTSCVRLQVSRAGILYSNKTTIIILSAVGPDSPARKCRRIILWMCVRVWLSAIVCNICWAWENGEIYAIVRIFHWLSSIMW